MSKFSQNRTTQFDEVEEPKFKKKVKEKRKSSDNIFLEDFEKPNDHWANKKKNKDVYTPFFSSLLIDERTFPKRLGIVWLMSNRKELDRDETLEMIINADDENEYYISIAVAWAFSFFYADDPSIKPYLDKLSPKTRKLAERKIRESRRCEPLQSSATVVSAIFLSGANPLPRTLQASPT